MEGKTKFHKRETMTPHRRADMDALIQSNLIGLRINAHEGQNFVVINESEHDIRTIIHGRDIFSPATAAEYFAPGNNPATFPYEKFGEKAKRKIRESLKELRPECEESFLRSLVTSQHLANPYADEFIGAEREVAGRLVHSVQPRMLRDALRDKTAILYSDKGKTVIFNDLLGSSHLPADGCYNRKKSTNEQGVIIITSPQVNRRFCEIARHEFGHFFDLGSGAVEYGINYVASYGTANIQQWVEKDLHNLKEISLYLRNIDAFSPAEEFARLKPLCKQRGYISGLAALEAMLEKTPDELVRCKPVAKGKWVEGVFETDEMIDALKKDILTLRRHARIFLSPDTLSEHEKKLYPTEEDRLTEIPAVIESLKGIFGAPFVKAMLPNLYDSVREAWRHNSRLAYSPPAQSPSR